MKKKHEPTREVTATRGKPFNAWLHPRDVDQIRRLVGWLNFNQDEKVSDSQLIRAALHLAQPGDGLIKAFSDVRADDARSRKRKR